MEHEVIFGDEERAEAVKEPKVEPELRILTARERAVILDDAKANGFWPWLMRYSVLGLPLLLSLFPNPPSSCVDLEEDDMLRLLKIAFESIIKKRTRLGTYETFTDVVDLIRKSNNIVVLTGAGVSVSCGIPDFRSKNGIYSRLSEFQLSDPQEMFDLEYFKYRPETFYSFAKEIYPSNFEPSSSHRFIKLLQDKGKLLRNYTQNIDTLENKAGITKVVQCHGSFATATCISCSHRIPGTDIEESIFAQAVPYCLKCKEGVIKPDIVFFGENLPNIFHDLWANDRKNLDLLIVIGSSLKVAPVANVTSVIAPDIPQILINMESLRHMEHFDVHLLGYCDGITSALTKALEWDSNVDIPTVIPLKGKEDWHWCFDGAMGMDIELESSSSDSDSLISRADSNTPDPEVQI